jgi:predicted PurR-regulated permease PerM
MKYKTLNLHRLASLLVIISLGTYIIVIGKSILAPLAFSVLFGFLLLPICTRIEQYIHYRPFAILLSMLAALLPALAIIVMFSYQFSTVIEDMPSISQKLKRGLSEGIDLLQQYINVDTNSLEESLRSNFSTLLETPVQIIGQSLSSGSTILVSLLLIILFTFFLMLYRTSFKNFALMQFRRNEREEASTMIRQVEKVLQEYLYGLLMVILILGVLNSTGLYFIGIKYAAFWGFLAACLAIIPYIGTTLGGFLPFVYALATTGTLWQPAAVVLLYSSVQTLEGNFITPKVVGGSVSINPLAAILFLFVGGMIWGISGLILALPFVAVLKVVMEHITPLRPVSELLSSDLYEDRDKFLTIYDKEEYRLSNYFRRQKKG